MSWAGRREGREPRTRAERPASTISRGGCEWTSSPPRDHEDRALLTERVLEAAPGSAPYFRGEYRPAWRVREAELTWRVEVGGDGAAGDLRRHPGRLTLLREADPVRPRRASSGWTTSGIAGAFPTGSLVRARALALRAARGHLHPGGGNLEPRDRDGGEVRTGAGGDQAGHVADAALARGARGGDARAGRTALGGQRPPAASRLSTSARTRATWGCNSGSGSVAKHKVVAPRLQGGVPVAGKERKPSLGGEISGEVPRAVHRLQRPTRRRGPGAGKVPDHFMGTGDEPANTPPGKSTLAGIPYMVSSAAIRGARSGASESRGGQNCGGRLPGGGPDHPARVEVDEHPAQQDGIHRFTPPQFPEHDVGHVHA